MSFQLPSDLKQTAFRIYLLGPFGVALGFFPVKIEKLPVLDAEIPAGEEHLVAGIVGIVVLYLVLSFIVNTAREFLIFRAERLRREIEHVATAESPNDLQRKKAKHIALEPLILHAQNRMSRNQKWLWFLTPLIALVEIGFPILVGSISLFILKDFIIALL